MKIIKWSSKKLGDHEILLDDEDFEKFGMYKWTVEKPTNGSSFYAKRKYTYALNKRKSIALHRAILGITDVSVFIDHIDGNGLNNQKANLRISTHKQNAQNSGIQKNNNTGFKGVILRTESKGRPYKTPRYVCNLNVRIPGSDKRIFYKGGSFLNPYEAALKYNELALKLYGEFANLNPVTAIRYKDGTMYTHEVRTPCITPIRDKDFIIERVRTFVPC